MADQWSDRSKAILTALRAHIYMRVTLGLTNAYSSAIMIPIMLNVGKTVRSFRALLHSHIAQLTLILLKQRVDGLYFAVPVAETQDVNESRLSLTKCLASHILQLKKLILDAPSSTILVPYTGFYQPQIFSGKKAPTYSDSGVVSGAHTFRNSF